MLGYSMEAFGAWTAKSSERFHGTAISEMCGTAFSTTRIYICIHVVIQWIDIALDFERLWTNLAALAICSLTARAKAMPLCYLMA
jgi:hypothetical protein